MSLAQDIDLPQLVTGAVTFLAGWVVSLVRGLNKFKSDIAVIEGQQPLILQGLEHQRKELDDTNSRVAVLDCQVGELRDDLNAAHDKIRRLQQLCERGEDY